MFISKENNYLGYFYVGLAIVILKCAVEHKRIVFTRSDEIFTSTKCTIIVEN